MTAIEQYSYKKINPKRAARIAAKELGLQSLVRLHKKPLHDNAMILKRRLQRIKREKKMNMKNMLDR